jgi:5-methylcytosine-specific restriction endonuclease McrA
MKEGVTMSKDKRRDLRAYRDRVAREKAKAMKSTEPIICHLCFKPIDMTLPYYDKWAWTLDHIKAIAVGGHILGDWLPAHRTCNSKKGDGSKQDPLKGASRNWALK